MMNIVILAGGKGTRLFPLSRNRFPKQFLKLFSDKTLIEETVSRFTDIDYKNIFIITNNEQKFLFNDLFDDLNTKPYIIPEPVGKNTAPAIALSILFLNDNDIIGVFPSDHFISNIKLFTKRLNQAISEARNDYIVTFGIVPEYAETGYGYIEISENFELTENDVFKVKKFKEKPDIETAKKYVESKKFFWNSGMFIFKVSKVIEEFKNHNNKIYEKFMKLREIVKPEFPVKERINIYNKNYKLINTIYKEFPEISFDYAICEKSDSLKVVKGDFIWTDIGSFDSYVDFLNKFYKSKTFLNSEQILNISEKQNNNIINIDSDKVFISGKESKFYSTIGIKDTYIIDTDDVLLVVKKGHSQKVKDLYNQIKKIKKDTTDFHTSVKRPWGIFKNIYETEKGFKVKRIQVNPGQKLSLQLHHKRAEHWVIVKGEGIVEVNERKWKVKKGDHIFIDVEEKHRIECSSQIPLVFIEVQIGDYLGEDDIERFDDIYGRV